MINEEEKFDDLLRTKMSEREFFFDEENWQKLNEKIEKDEKRKKQRRTAFIFFGGLVLGIGLTIPLMYLVKPSNNTISNTQGSTTTNNTTINNQTVAINNKAVQAGNTQPAVGAGSSAANPSAENINNTNKASTNVVAENNNRTASRPAEKATVANNSAQVKHSNKNNSDVNKSVIAVNSNQPIASVKRHGNKASNTNSTVSNSVAVNTNQPVASSKGHKTSTSTNNKSIVNKTIVAVNAPGTLNTTSGQTNGNETSSNTSAQTTLQSNQTTATNNLTQANSPATITKTETGNNAQPNTTSQQTAQVDNKHTTENNAQKQTVPDQTDSNDPIPIIKPPARLKAANILSIDAGGGYSFRWKNFGVAEASGITPVIGVSVTHLFSTKFGVSAGVQYNSLNGLKTGYSNAVTNYDFGSRDSTTTVTPKTLQYITVPLMARYLIDDNDAICLGVSFGYLLNTSSTVATTTQTELTNPTTKTQTASGYTGGFNTLDVQLRLAYRRRIYKAFSASIEGYYGITDDENNTYFDNTFKRNSGVRLIFSYDLIK